MSWENDLEVMTWGGIEINVQSVSDDFTRRIINYDYPYKDGSELEDLGREARPSSFAAIFFGDGYLSELGALIQLIDEGKTQTLKHPLFGTWQAKCTRANVTHNHDRRDSALVDLEFLEDGVNTSIPEIFSIGAVQSEMLLGVDELQSADDALTENIDSLTAFIDDATAFIDDVDAQISDLTARFERLKKYGQAYVDELSQKVADHINWPAVRAARRLVNSGARLKGRVERIRPRISDTEIAVHTPLVAIAMARYSDPDRADELQRVNKVRNPMLVPPGTKLKIYSE